MKRGEAGILRFVRTRALHLAVDLGLVALTWSCLCALEMVLHAPAIDRRAVLTLLPGTALAFSAGFGALVLLVHGAQRAIGAYLSRRAALAVLALVLALAASSKIARLAGSLVEGEWIAEHPQVAWIRIGLVVALELAWLATWALYAVSLVIGARGRVVQASFWLLVLGALGVASVLLQGPLRAYEQLAQHAVLPAWLFALAVARRVHGLLLDQGWPGSARALGLTALAAGVAALVFSALDPDRARYTRAEALASSSFHAIALTLVPSAPRRLGHLDFERAPIARCPEPHALPPLPLRDAQRGNVIFLSIDTMRRDAIGKRIGGRAVAPSFEAFGQRSVFFERAVSPAAGTLFSLSAALTGHSVSQLLYMPRAPRNVLSRARDVLTRQHVFFPDWPAFKIAAFDKLLVQGTPVTYVNRKASPLPPFLEALDTARAAGERGFFWLHLVEPHGPYSTHKGFDFGDTVAARYYSEVAYDDAIMGRVLAHLQAHGYFDNSLIALFSDHGEALGEDGGYLGHGVSMKGLFTDVPLYVSYPGVTPRVSRAAVSLTSLMPSVMHFLGKKLPADISACSLLEPESALARCALPVSTSYGLRSEAMREALRQPMRTREDLAVRQLRIEQLARFAPELSFTSSDHRYLVNLATGAERLFERSDAMERHNLVREEPAVTQRFRLAVTRWTDHEATRIACALPKKK
jgi:arylsulfatase A-like enzyme